MPTRLSGLDASFLYLETSTSHMHVGSALILNPCDLPDERLTRDDVARHLETRLHLGPPFRRRLEQVPLRLGHPVWIEDPDFDLDFHVRRGALPAPGGMRELAEYAADVMSRRLDRTRPLWELHVVEGLADGRVALVTKTHHAAVDGVSGAELLAAILQLSPDDEPAPPERAWRPEQPPGDLRLLAQAGLRLAVSPWAVARMGARIVGAAAGLVRLGPPADVAPPAPFTAPMTVLNGAISSHRRMDLVDLSLADVKTVKNAFGGTVNDVILALVAGALRTYLEQRGEATPPMVGMVPISVHAEGPKTGNQVSAMLVALPVDEPDAVRRLEVVRRGTTGAKERHGAMGASTIQQLAELAPAGVASLAARGYTRAHGADRHRPIWNLVVSNVPGPRVPLYCAGARVEAMYPLGPIHEMCGLNITLFSYEDNVFVGINADRDLVGDVEAIGQGLRDALDELAKRAAETTA